MIYQTDISYRRNYYDKATNQKIITYNFIAPISHNAVLFQPRPNHKCRVKRNSERKFHPICFTVFVFNSLWKIVLLLSLSIGRITGMCICDQ